MGTKNTKSLIIFQNGKVGSMSIDLGKSSHIPGEEIKGNVWIKVLQDIEVYGCELKVQMEEKWFYKEDKNEYTENNTQYLIDISLQISNYLNRENILLKGNYEIPFLITLPSYLSPSFEFQGVNAEISLRYVVYCCLLSTKGENFCLSNLNYLFLRSKSISNNDSLKTYSCCVNLHSWFILEKGSCILNVNLLKNNFKIGERVNLICHIDNSRSKLKVNYLKVSLIQKLYLKNIHSGSGDRTSYENEILFKKVNINCLPKSLVSIPTDLDLNNPLINSNLYGVNATNGVNGTGGIPFWQFLNNSDDVFNFQPTIDSSLIKCDYNIKVSLHFNTFVHYSKRPRVIIPINIANFNNQNEESILERRSLTNLNTFNQGYEDINAICDL